MWLILPDWDSLEQRDKITTTAPAHFSSRKPELPSSELGGTHGPLSLWPAPTGTPDAVRAARIRKAQRRARTQLVDGSSRLLPSLNTERQKHT